MKKTDPLIQVKAIYPVAIKKVWSALTEPAQMRKWFFDAVESFQPTVGFSTQFRVENEGKTFTHQWTIKEVIPFQKLSYDWNYQEYEGDGYVVFDLSKVTEGTQLVLTNFITADYPSNIPEFRRESCIAGWEYFLHQALKEYLLK